jgi:hypothetical protein
MENDQIESTVTTRSAGVRYGLIGGIVSIAWFLVMSVAGLDSQGPAQYLGWVLIIVFIVLAQKYFKDNGDGYMSYGQGIGIAFWYALVSSVISSVFVFIYISFIDSGYLDAIKDKQLEALEKQGMSEAQIEQAMQITSSFMSPGMMLVMGLFGGIVLSVIFALIITIFTQKNSPERGI